MFLRVIVETRTLFYIIVDRDAWYLGSIEVLFFSKKLWFKRVNQNL